MHIRTATLSDAPGLTTLAATTLREAFGPPHNPADVVEDYVQSAITLPILETELADPNARFFVLEDDNGRSVGYAKMRRAKPPRRMPESYRRAGRAVELQRIYLLASQTGRGYGARLMQHCLEWARTAGYQAVWLGVWEHNSAALAFYYKMGFEQFGYHYFQFGPERQRDFWLLKSLTS